MEQNVKIKQSSFQERVFNKLFIINKKYIL